MADIKMMVHLYYKSIKNQVVDIETFFHEVQTFDEFFQEVLSTKGLRTIAVMDVTCFESIIT